MVSNYKRKSDRQKWSEESMKQAIQMVSARVMGLRKASESFKVPKTTLKRRLHIYTTKNQNIDEAAVKKMGRFTSIFNKEQEKELAAYVKNMESRFFGLTTKDLRSLAYDLAEKNNINHNFDHDTKMAGRYWLENFINRNPDLSLLKPEATSAARVSGFNQVSVNIFFSLLTEIVDKYKLTPDKIFNVDETGMTTVSKSLPKIVSAKGKKQVGLLTSAERGQLVTTVFSVGADGSYMPPLFVFPRKRFKPELMNNAPPGSFAECHESRWIQKDIFTKWFEKFITFSRASKDNPVQLLLDGHASHTKNLNVINLAREHGVHIISFPPHCTHRLQSPNVGFMKPLSAYYTEAAKQWLRTNPGRVITQFPIAELVGKAFVKAATIPTAHNSFRATGVWPLDPDIFTDADFLAADTTDIVGNDQNGEETNEPQPCCSKPLSPADTSFSKDLHDEDTDSDNEPLSRLPIKSSSSSKSSFIVSPLQIMPVPKTGQAKRAKRRRGKTAIITSSPYRTELETSQANASQVKGKVRFDDTVEKEDRKGKKSNKKKNTRKIIERDDHSSEDDTDVECLYCHYLYSVSTEGWIQCTKCNQWAHFSCAGVEDEDDEVVYVCEKCLE